MWWYTTGIIASTVNTTIELQLMAKRNQFEVSYVFTVWHCLNWCEKPLIVSRQFTTRGHHSRSPVGVGPAACQAVIMKLYFVLIFSSFAYATNTTFEGGLYLIKFTHFNNVVIQMIQISSKLIIYPKENWCRIGND